MNNPVVSIIIATFNSECTLRTALESVMNQTFRNWECIVVDGASKDGTIDIVKEYVAKDSRFRYISEPDKGIYDAFNKGWRMAKGEWVLYLGSDDQLVSDGVSQLVTTSNEYDVVYGDVILRFRNGNEKYQKCRDANSLTTKFWMPCCHQSLMMRREVIEHLGGFNEHFSIIADKELVFRCYTQNYRFNKVQAPISKFFIGGVSQTSNKCVFENYEIAQKYFGRLWATKYFVRAYFMNSLIILKHKFQ